VLKLPVLGAGLTPLRLQAGAFEALARADSFGHDVLPLLQTLAGQSGICRLYVQSREGSVEIGRFLDRWPITQRWFEQDSGPLTLAMALPRVRVAGVERQTASDLIREWVGRLQGLPIGSCVLRLMGGPPSVVKVDRAEVPRFSEATTAYLADANCRSDTGPVQRLSITDRLAEIDRLAAGAAVSSSSTRPNGRAGRTVSPPPPVHTPLGKVETDASIF
jgi:hypothetical protein